jgi:hypothetical protein
MASFYSGDYVGAVVADLGAYSSKIGWAGDDYPVSYFRSVSTTTTCAVRVLCARIAFSSLLGGGPFVPLRGKLTAIAPSLVLRRFAFLSTFLRFLGRLRPERRGKEGAAGPLSSFLGRSR